jgi:hypothetical protein
MADFVVSWNKNSRMTSTEKLAGGLRSAQLLRPKLRNAV